MSARPVHPRVPHTSVLDLRHLHSRVQRRRPKPKNEAPPKHYHDLIEQLDKTSSIPQNYSDASKDNIRGIQGKFIRWEQILKYKGEYLFSPIQPDFVATLGRTGARWFGTVRKGLQWPSSVISVLWIEWRREMRSINTSCSSKCCIINRMVVIWIPMMRMMLLRSGLTFILFGSLCHRC